MKPFKLGKNKKIIDISKINYNIISHEELKNKKIEDNTRNSNSNNNIGQLFNSNSNNNSDLDHLKFSNSNSIMINPSHKRHYYLVDEENKIIPEVGFNTKPSSHKDYLNKIYLKQIEQNKIKKIEEKMKEKEEENKRLKLLMDNEDNYLKKSKEVKNIRTRYFLTDVRNIIENKQMSNSNSQSNIDPNINIVRANELTISNKDINNMNIVENNQISNINNKGVSYIEEERKEKEKMKYKKNLYKDVLDSQIAENNYWAKNFINDYGNLATEFEHLKEKKKCTDWSKRNFNMNLNIKPCKIFIN